MNVLGSVDRSVILRLGQPLRTGTAKHSFQKDLEALQSGGGKGIPGGVWWEMATEVSVTGVRGWREKWGREKCVHSGDITSQRGGGRTTRQGKLTWRKSGYATKGKGGDLEKRHYGYL